MTDATQPDWDPRAESVLQNQRQAYDKMLDILPALKDGDSLYRTAMPDRKNVLGRIDVAVVSDTTLTASPFSYSQT